MAAELTDHVGYEKHEAAGHKSGNSRNGTSAKTLKRSFGDRPREVPRDRNGTQIIDNHQTRFTGCDQISFTVCSSAELVPTTRFVLW